MSHGFDRSRPDVGGIESRVTTEDTIRYNENSTVSSGTADPLFLEEIMDTEFWEVEPEVTRVATIVQAFQSRIFASAEVSVSDIRRQWYLKRSQDLRRFADMMAVRSIDLSLEAYRSRLHDVFLANQDGGALKAYHRVLGAYTGIPAFVTRTDRFPGYWILGTSRLTPQSILVPAIPRAGIHITSASGETVPGIGTLTVDPGPPIVLTWTAPGDEEGDPVEILADGRYFIRSGTEIYQVYVEVDTAAFGASASATAMASAFPVHVLPYPDTCCDEQDWLPGPYNLVHGLVAETFGINRISEVTRDEMVDILKRSADHPPVGVAMYGLEEPGLVGVDSDLSPIWCDSALAPFATAFPPSAVTYGAGTAPVLGADYSPTDTAVPLFATGVGTDSVPQLCGPFVVIKERFNQYEDAIAENFELGPTFNWRVRDDLVSRTEELTGVFITEVSFETLSGVGLMSFDSASGTLLWQAPGGVDDPFQLDPLGAGAELSTTAPTVTPPALITGVAIAAVAEDTANGVGVLEWDGVARTLSWRAPGDASAGTPVPVPTEPGGITRLRSSTVAHDIILNITIGLLPTAPALTDSITVTNTHAGIRLVAISANTQPGDGGLAYTAPSGGDPAKLAWLAPGDIPPGADTDIESSGNHILTSNSGSRITVFIDDLADLPTSDTFSPVTVTAPLVITDGGEFRITSGNSLYSLRIRVLPNQLPTVSVRERVRIRTAELRTVPVLTTSLSATAVDFSLLDRTYSENVIRRIYQRQGNSDDESDASYDPDLQDFLELKPYDRIALTNPFIQFRITIEDHADFVSTPTVNDYEFVGIALRKTIVPPVPRCLLVDDFVRLAAGGFNAECNLITHLGFITNGLDGFLTTVSSPHNAIAEFVMPGLPLPL